MHEKTALPENRSQQRKGRLQLIALILMVVVPILLASSMYKWRFWVPESRNYHGELLGDGRTLADLGISGDIPQTWLLLVSAPDDCLEECRKLVYLARQIHIALGREASRAHHALATDKTLPADYQEQLTREYPQLARFNLDNVRYQAITDNNQKPQLWIIDPLGNLVLRYAPGSNGKSILKDLQLLLKLSKIG